MYPTVDLFLAPLLAGVAVIVDQTLAEDTSISEKDNDIIFLTTFGLLAAVGIIWSGTLLTLAGVFKLANLGSFLPFNVISGFFSAVGILTWTLSVNIDCGKGIGKILFSGDKELLKYFFVHHTPSFVVAGIMKYLGPKNPMFVVFVVIATIALVHCILLISGVSLEEAKDMGWFWGKDELVYKNSGDLVSIKLESCFQLFDKQLLTPLMPVFFLRLDSMHGPHRLRLVYSTKLHMGMFIGERSLRVCQRRLLWVFFT